MLYTCVQIPRLWLSQRRQFKARLLLYRVCHAYTVWRPMRDTEAQQQRGGNRGRRVSNNPSRLSETRRASGQIFLWVLPGGIAATFVEHSTTLEAAGVNLPGGQAEGASYFPRARCATRSSVQEVRHASHQALGSKDIIRCSKYVPLLLMPQLEFFAGCEREAALVSEGTAQTSGVQQAPP